MRQENARAKRPRNYQKRLLAKQSELSSSLRAKIAVLEERGDTALEDSATTLHDQFVALRVNRFDYAQLKLIEAALARIDSKEYGVCLECGDPISKRRLDALPWAVHCITCQELSGSDHDSGFANDPARIEEMSTR